MKKVVLLLVVCLLLVGCIPNGGNERPLPTLNAIAQLPPTLPPTFTPPPVTDTIPPTTQTQLTRLPTLPTVTPLPIPTNSPLPPTWTPTPTPTNTPPPEGTAFVPIIKPLDQYGYDEIIPYQAFPRPANDNGWGIHWIPTTSQSPDVVDRFVGELVKMHIKWVVFLNGEGDTNSNNYLVDRLVANGIMPVMRIYRSDTSPYEGDIAGMVAHFRARGVYYYQIYNEPNINVENGQGFANPNDYAQFWANAARQVIASGGLPGIGAFSPGGQYSHYEFLDRTLRALEFNGEAFLLNHAWLSVHNYHGLRRYDDPDGFLLFRNYNDIVVSHLGRSLPIIGTEGGSYSPNKDVEKELLIYQYTYMRAAEPYYFVFSHWLLANREGGGFDDTWEWQALFQPGFVHPVITDFFYQNAR